MSNIYYKDKDITEIIYILNKIDDLYGSACIWVTNIKENISWCSEKMMRMFNLESQYVPELENVLLKYVHLFDKAEFTEKIGKRLQGEELENELLIHLLDRDGKFYMYRFYTDMIYAQDGTPQYLVVVMKNQNIIPDIDAITDLYSQERFIKDLDVVIRELDTFAVLQIHIDGFSTFNLIYGRDYVNELLKAISINFIYIMTDETAVYHAEGEDFIFILRHAQRLELMEFENRIREILKSGIKYQGKIHSFKIASGGILIDNYTGDASSLYGQLEYALEQSIRNNRAQLVVFNDVVQTARGVDYDLMKIIHESVRNECEGFYLEYQPIVDALNGKVVGVEALLRWNLEPYGKIPPAAFIGWMEKDPSMYELGNYVLRRALEETIHIIEKNPTFFVNVNVSVRQIERAEFRTDVLKSLEETKFPGNHLCMELTERCKDFPVERLKEEVDFLHRRGIRVAIDDYGTGSASSTIVLNVPMDEIKIDMSFVRGITENGKKQAMVRSIVDFANECGMNTCIEGVEDENLETYLRQYAVRWFQGYYYSKPVSIKEVEKLLNN